VLAGCESRAGRFAVPSVAGGSSCRSSGAGVGFAARAGGRGGWCRPARVAGACAFSEPQSARAGGAVACWSRSPAGLVLAGARRGGLDPWWGARRVRAGFAAPGEVSGIGAGGGPVLAGARQGDRSEGWRVVVGCDTAGWRVGEGTTPCTRPARWVARGVRSVPGAWRTVSSVGAVLCAASRALHATRQTAVVVG